MGIWLDKGALTKQRIDDKVRERVREIAQSMSIISKQGAGPEQWDLLIDRCIAQISDLQSKRPHWKWYMADMTNLDGQKLKAALDEFAEVGLHPRKNNVAETLTKKRKLMQVGMYLIAPMLLLFFVMMCKYRGRQGRNLRSRVFADKGGLQRLDKFPCRAI